MALPMVIYQRYRVRGTTMVWRQQQQLMVWQSPAAHGFRGSLAVAGWLADFTLCRHRQKGRW